MNDFFFISNIFDIINASNYSGVLEKTKDKRI